VQGRGYLAEDFLAPANRVLEHADSAEAAFVDVRIDRAGVCRRAARPRSFAMLRSNLPWRRRQHGAAVVEFALVSAVYLFLILLVIEFGLLFWIDLTMQHAVREGARYAITGQSNLDPNVSNQQRYLAVIEKMKEQSMGHWDSVHPQISITRGGSTQTYPNQGSYSTGMFGAPGEVVVIRVDCTWPIMPPLKTLLGATTSQSDYHFSVAATMRNEAFE
jgi:Flp pilus assembly protein TadG